jgi:hypothetical protein
VGHDVLVSSFHILVSMSSIVNGLLEGCEDRSCKPFVVASRMTSYIGSTVYTIRSEGEKKIQDKTFQVLVVERHKIEGTTISNLSEIKIDGVPLKDHYKKEYDIELVHLDLPGFKCSEGHILAPELCHKDITIPQVQ